MFKGCPAYQAVTYESNVAVCTPCTIEGCYQCENSQSCSKCIGGYQKFYNSNYQCREKSPNLNVNYFIKSGVSYQVSDENSALTWTYTGTTPDSPFPFIQFATSTIANSLTLNYDELDITIWLGKGNHFFFQCEQEQYNGNGLAEYCSVNNKLNGESFLKYFFKYKFQSDNLRVKVKPLECQLAGSMGYSDNENFQEMCIQELTENTKPTLFINHANAYFDIYGSWSFENIKFTGINAFSVPSKSSYTLSTLPIQLCELIKTPSGPNSPFLIKKTGLENFPINYSCKNSWYDQSEVANITKISKTCQTNDGEIFSSKQDSTLSSTGEPNHEDFFWNDDITNKYGELTPKRRNTLFNLNTLNEFESTRQGPTMLSLFNCEFEYFLANYESLINVNNIEILKDSLSYYYYNSHYNPTYKQNYDKYTIEFDIFTYQSSERGAKIKINSCEFKHSSFGKGLISYRKQPLIQDNLYFMNYTHLWMSSTQVDDEGSYIIIENSSFQNLNYLKNITALAIYGGSSVMREFISSDSQNTSFEYQGFIHKGIILNLEDFGGYIEINNCSFKQNMHFIPEILITNHSGSLEKDVAGFKDSSTTQEYKMSKCDLDSYQDQYFFAQGVNNDDDIDEYYDLFERLSLIYISRNRNKIIIKDNIFHQNIGSFGGAISINSPNFLSSNSSLILILNNIFTQNMAYFSGNAIYIRLTKKTNSLSQFCGGVSISQNTFKNNIGMKIHNGGAVSIYCKYISTLLHEDYFATSSFGINFGDELIQTYKIQDGIDYSTHYSLLPYFVKLDSNIFTENYSGMKGTALFLRHINQIKIYNCSFIENGPVFAQMEELYSPYYLYFSNRSITYFSENDECPTEFSFITYCSKDNKEIDWYNVQGAVYIENCEVLACLTYDNLMGVLIEHCIFSNNQAGPFLNSQLTNEQASSLYIKGGFNNIIKDTSFIDNKGLYLSHVQHRAQPLIDFFNADYFEHQQSPLVYIYLNPDSYYSNSYFTFNTTFEYCNFKRNSHFQVIGIAGQKQYFGSLITFVSTYGEESSSFLPVINIISTNIEENQFIGPESSLIYIENGILQFFRNTVKNNGFLSSEFQEGKIYNYGLNSFIFTSYSINLSQNYGILRIKGTYELKNHNHQIANNQFKYTFSEFGSVYFINLEGQFALIENNIYNFNIASKSGSIMNAFGQELQSMIIMKNEDIQYQGSKNGTIVLTSNNLKSMSILISETKFSNFYASMSSALNFYNLQKVIVQNSSFTQPFKPINLKQQIFNEFDGNTKDLYDFIDSNTLSLITSQIISTKSQIFLNSLDGTGDIYFGISQFQSKNYQYNSFVEFINCNFSNLYADSASVFYISQSKVLHINNDVRNNGIYQCSQEKQGVILVENNGEYLGINQIIQKCSSHTIASVVFADQYSNISFHNTYFLENNAISQGLAVIQGSSTLNCLNCKFEKNYASDSSILFAVNNKEGSININSSLFIQNSAYSNMIYAIYSNLYIQNSLFYDNTAEIVNNGITIANSNLEGENITVDHLDQAFLQRDNYGVESGFFLINPQSSIKVSNSKFRNTRGQNAGTLYAFGSSKVSIDNNSSFHNCFSQYGSVIYSSGTKATHIANSLFQQNSNIDIWVSNANATIMNNMHIGNQQFIKSESASLIVQQNVFKDGTNYAFAGKAIYCSCKNLTLQNNTFFNLSGVQGGALFLTSSHKQSHFTVEGNIFRQVKAQHGGAIYILDGATINIYRNEFENNEAVVVDEPSQLSQSMEQKGLGGAIYHACSNKNIGLYKNCNVSIAKQNLFLSNSADHGGGIIWTSNRFIDDGSNEFRENKASYGENIASYPKDLKLEFITNNDYINPINNQQQKKSLRQLSNQYDKRKLDEQIDHIVSGTPFEFKIIIYDQEGNVYTADSSSVATLQSYSNSVLLKNNLATSASGVYHFQQVTVFAYPGTNVSLSLSIQGLGSFQNDVDFLNEDFSLEIQLRNCSIGEQFTPQLSCVACPKNEYSYSAPNTITSCKPCNESAICYGLNQTAPIPGVWRNKSDSENWVTCPRKSSCLGGNQSCPNGVCTEGYTGIACADCIEGYSKIGPYECSQCPVRWRNSLITIFLVLAQLGYMAFLVKSTMNSAQQDKPLYSVYLKIMTNHFQIIGVISNIQFAWPPQIDSVVNSQSKVTKTSEQIYSFDCFLTDNGTGLSPYYQKLVIFGLLPIFLCVFSIIFWLLYYIVRYRSFKGIKNSMFSCLVVILFLIHPNLCTQIFQSFDCIELDNVSYLKYDIKSVCYEGTHLFFILTVSLPSIILWIIGIPLFALILLIKNKQTIQLNDLDYDKLDLQQKLKLYEVKLKYGFLFNGYKFSQCYWEILIIYRKVALVMVTVYISNVSTEVQILLAMLIIVVELFVQIHYKPFITKELNKMEMYSLLICSITMYCGMYYVTGRNYYYINNSKIKWFFLICLGAPNIGFLLYWMIFLNLEFLKIIARKSLKIFKIITCGCIDIEKFKKKYKIDAGQQNTLIENKLKFQKMRTKIQEQFANKNEEEGSLSKKIDTVRISEERENIDDNQSEKSFECNFEISHNEIEIKISENFQKKFQAETNIQQFDSADSDKIQDINPFQKKQPRKPKQILNQSEIVQITTQKLELHKEQEFETKELSNNSLHLQRQISPAKSSPFGNFNTQAWNNQDLQKQEKEAQQDNRLSLNSNQRLKDEDVSFIKE